MEPCCLTEKVKQHFEDDVACLLYQFSPGIVSIQKSEEAIQLLLLADDEQNLEAAAKFGKDIPELVLAAQSLHKILNLRFA